VFLPDIIQIISQFLDTIGVMRALRITQRTFLLPLIANAASAKAPQEGHWPQ
jgi:hypothetical protein